MILRVRAGDDHSVGLDAREAFAMQILVGRDVVGVALGLEPVEKKGIGVELHDRRSVAATPAQHLGSHRQVRLQARVVKDAPTVGMAVIERTAELAAKSQKHLMGLNGEESPVPLLASIAMQV